MNEEGWETCDRMRLYHELAKLFKGESERGEVLLQICPPLHQQLVVDFCTLGVPDIGRQHRCRMRVRP